MSSPTTFLPSPVATQPDVNNAYETKLYNDIQQLESDKAARARPEVLIKDATQFYQDQTPGASAYPAAAIEVINGTNFNGMVAAANLAQFTGSTTSDASLEVEHDLAVYDYNNIIANGGGSATIVQLDQDHVDAYANIRAPITFWSGAIFASDGLPWLSGATASDSQGLAGQTSIVTLTPDQQQAGLNNLVSAVDSVLPTGVLYTSLSSLEEFAQDCKLAAQYDANHKTQAFWSLSKLHNFANEVLDGAAFGFGGGVPLELVRLLALASKQVSPLVLDLTGGGITLTPLGSASPYFDLTADGFARKTGWIGSGTGLLCIDSTNSGQVTSISQLFGNATTNGFTILKGLDSNNDGIISAADARFSQLRVWQDANDNGVVDPGELSTLAQLGIASINTAHDDDWWPSLDYLIGASDTVLLNGPLVIH